MRDVNEPIRVAYANALLQVPGVGVYYQSLPNNQNPDNYIVFRSINSTDGSTKDSARVNLNITIEIHTKGNIGNQGLSADAIADNIFQLCYPNKHTNLTLFRGEIIWTQIANDVTFDFQQKNQFGYISRFITFRHEIYAEGTGISGGSGVVVIQGELFRLEYTGIGGEISFSNAALQNKTILDVSKDGVGCSRIITTGIPVDKEALYTSLTGTITFAMAIEPGEEIFVLYQLK